MDIPLTTLRHFLIEAAELGAQQALIESGHLKPYMSKSEAYKMYGRANVDRWVQEGIVNLIKDGIDSAKIRISRIEIETVAKTSNRIPYLQAKLRKTK